MVEKEEGRGKDEERGRRGKKREKGEEWDDVRARVPRAAESAKPAWGLTSVGLFGVELDTHAYLVSKPRLRHGEGDASPGTERSS